MKRMKRDRRRKNKVSSDQDDPRLNERRYMPKVLPRHSKQTKDMDSIAKNLRRIVLTNKTETKRRSLTGILRNTVEDEILNKPKHIERTMENRDGRETRTIERTD